ncbi:hypothetical protein BJ508DRAFT_63046 [Ascobolus immersus RN42]|uniref:Uncharacterized protein n=1 Tax=Ascobolus immersus RN42 TaxID=1160509 RepID=A0A3N4INZ6_ASCIM|nr:hypothetical protein BJ508DRAFT_63046 [Ascobolus immersus RN42]
MSDSSPKWVYIVTTSIWKGQYDLEMEDSLTTEHELRIDDYTGVEEFTDGVFESLDDANDRATDVLQDHYRTACAVDPEVDITIEDWLRKTKRSHNYSVEGCFVMEQYPEIAEYPEIPSCKVRVERHSYHRSHAPTVDTVSAKMEGIDKPSVADESIVIDYDSANDEDDDDDDDDGDDDDDDNDNETETAVYIVKSIPLGQSGESFDYVQSGIHGAYESEEDANQKASDLLSLHYEDLAKQKIREDFERAQKIKIETSTQEEPKPSVNTEAPNTELPPILVRVEKHSLVYEIRGLDRSWSHRSSELQGKYDDADLEAKTNIRFDVDKPSPFIDKTKQNIPDLECRMAMGSPILGTTKKRRIYELCSPAEPPAAKRVAIGRTDEGNGAKLSLQTVTVYELVKEYWESDYERSNAPGCYGQHYVSKTERKTFLRKEGVLDYFLRDILGYQNMRIARRQASLLFALRRVMMDEDGLPAGYDASDDPESEEAIL